MGTAPASGNDVVDVFGRAAAVLALVGVPNEDSPPRQRCARPVRNLHEVVQADHAGGLDLEGLRTKHRPIGLEDLSLALESKHERTPHRDDAQRLVRRIQYQGSSQCGCILPNRGVHLAARADSCTQPNWAHWSPRGYRLHLVWTDLASPDVLGVMACDRLSVGEDAK